VSDLFGSTSPNSNVVEDNEIEGGSRGIVDEERLCECQEVGEVDCPILVQIEQRIRRPEALCELEKVNEAHFPAVVEIS
tara:strand:- start:5175 stop:5411 length:237 start_codon:yes stop_codon:yes gene_type:complete